MMLRRQNFTQKHQARILEAHWFLPFLLGPHEILLEQRLLPSFEQEIVLPFEQNFAVPTIASPETFDSHVVCVGGAS